MKPDDVTQEAWDEARHVLSNGFEILIESVEHAVRIARAIMAAEQRGAEREREACAQVADNLFYPDETKISSGIRAAIRNRSNAS